MQALQSRKMAGVGIHCLLEAYECRPDRLDDLRFIQTCLRQAAHIAGATLLEECGHKFEPHGVTALVLLAESHISIHTWPEQGYAAIDVFTCGSHTLPQSACNYLVEVLQARSHHLRQLPRGRAA